MKSIVEQVVDVLNEVGVLGSMAEKYYNTIKLNDRKINKQNVSPRGRDKIDEAIYKRAVRQIQRKEITPAKTTGEFDIHKKIKERERKDFKRAHPTAKGKYNVARRKWEKRAEEVLQRKEEIEKEITHHLTEITIRTGAIVGYLALVKKWANRVDSLASSIKQKASAFDTADTLEKRNKIDKELWTIKSDSDKALRSMSMYNSLIGAASGLGADRAYKEFKKYTKRRK